MDPRTQLGATALAGTTFAEICLDVARKAAIACGLDGDAPEENVVTWAIDIEPGMVPVFVTSLGDEFHRRCVQDPRSVASCSNTATKLFNRLTTSGGVEREFANLGEDVGGAATAPERSAFHVKFSNHEFIIVVGYGIAEVVQSFEAKYSLGWCLRQSTPYSPERLQQYLGDIASPHVQGLLFGSPLKKEDPRAEYKKAGLKPDEEIRRLLFECAIDSLALYRDLL